MAQATSVVLPQLLNSTAVRKRLAEYADATSIDDAASPLARLAAPKLQAPCRRRAVLVRPAKPDNASVHLSDRTTMGASPVARHLPPPSHVWNHSFAVHTPSSSQAPPVSCHRCLWHPGCWRQRSYVSSTHGTYTLRSCPSRFQIYCHTRRPRTPCQRASGAGLAREPSACARAGGTSCRPTQWQHSGCWPTEPSLLSATPSSQRKRVAGAGSDHE